jgi:hypothetical protein
LLSLPATLTVGFNTHQEVTMWKAVLAGTVTLAVVGTSIVYAQQRNRGLESQQRPQLTQEDRAAFAAARIAALKAGLALNAEQEKNWPAFESALKDLSKFRMEQMLARRNTQRSDDPTERMRQRAERLSGYGAALKKLADAQGPLYSGLDEAQKRRFAMLTQAIQASRHGHHRHHRRAEGRRGMHERFHRRDDRGREMRGDDGWRRHGHGFGMQHEYRRFGRNDAGEDTPRLSAPKGDAL